MTSKLKYLAALLPILAMSGMTCNGREEISEDEMRMIIKERSKNRKIPKGCSMFLIEGVEIIALNEQTAKKKFKRMK
jgi:hypothetical protein